MLGDNLKDLKNSFMAIFSFIHITKPLQTVVTIDLAPPVSKDLSLLSDWILPQF